MCDVIMCTCDKPIVNTFLKEEKIEEIQFKSGGIRHCPLLLFLFHIGLEGATQPAKGAFT